MGFIRWFKKESDGSSSQRRDSAPPRSLENIDPNKSKTAVYNKSFDRFNEWRENERHKRLSMGDTRNSNTNDHEFMNWTHKNRSSMPLNNDDLLIGSNEHIDTRPRQNDQLVSNCVQMQIPRHSLPTNMTKYKKKRVKLPSQNVIHEDEVKEFEHFHCYGNLECNNGQTIYNSPPSKFYKQNSNPYPVSVNDDRTLYPTTSTQPQQLFYNNTIDNQPGPCPKKPKRILLKQNDTTRLTKELSDAHFHGAYQNYQVQSPYYSKKDINSRIQTPTMTPMALNNDENKNSGNYQVIINKHGDVVEYALPFTEQTVFDWLPAQPLPSDDLNFDDEIFQEDPQECEKLINENSDFLINDAMPETIENPYRSPEPVVYRKSSVMVTDLDKSVESSRTLDTKRQSIPIFNDLSSLSKWSDNFVRCINPKIKSQYPIIICSVNELKLRISVLGNTFLSPLTFMSGTFRTSKVTLRNYGVSDTEINDNLMLIAETAIRRDFNIIKRIRHTSIINLMALACNAELKEMALVMEPADYTLHYFLHEMNEKLPIFDSISIVLQISSATLYLQKCGLIHSNISSHTILMSRCPMHVKLTSFELATDISLETQMEIESIYKRTSKVINTCDGNKIDKNIPLSENIATLYDKYREKSKMIELNKMSTIYSARCIRELDAKYLPYCVEYRQQLAPFQYQPPELLLAENERFVFPTKEADVYSLTLLLWELLNGCVPFAIFDVNELKEIYAATNNAQLPIFEDVRCEHFKQIFKSGLKCDPHHRSMNVHHLIESLEEIKFDINSEEKEMQTIHENENLHEIKVNNTCKSIDTYDYPKKQSSAVDNIYENTADLFADIISPEKRFNSKPQRTVKISPRISPAAVSNDQQLKNHSPLNNVTNSTLYRSVLDYNKLLSPRRAANANIYERTSTLKKRKKATQSNQTKKSIKGLFDFTADDELKLSSDDLSPKLNENIQRRKVHAMNEETAKSIIVRELEYPDDTDVQQQSNKLPLNNISAQVTNELEAAPGAASRVTETTNTSRPNNSSYHFTIDEYELPKHLIARNNKIRRNTWLSSDTVNMTENSTIQPGPIKNVSMQNRAINETVPAPMPLTAQTTNISASSLNENTQNKKKLNVSIKIVHKQLSPNSSEQSLSTAELNSTVSDHENEDSPSVMSRIKFFSSLDHPTNDNFNINNKSSGGRRQQNKSLSESPSTEKNQKLLQEINDITAEISKCLSENRHGHFLKNQQDVIANKQQTNNLIAAFCLPHSPEKDMRQIEKELYAPNENISILATKLFADTDDDKEILSEEKMYSPNDEKRNLVKETVQRFENTLQPNNISVNGSFKKIENKLLNEKIINTDVKMETSNHEINDLNQKDVEDKMDIDDVMEMVVDTEEMREKVEDVMQIVELSEIENESGTSTSPFHTPITKSNQTLIKRTFYQESIISGTNVELPELEKMLDSQPSAQNMNATISTKSSSTTKLTTRVTLNLRKLRRSSDVGLFTTHHQQIGCDNLMNDARHSICGNELFENKSNTIMNQEVSGRSFEQISNAECNANGHQMDVSIAKMSNKEYNQLCISAGDVSRSSKDVLSSFQSRAAYENRQIQSIEDLYIDDDFCQGICLAANMKLIANSTDTLDNIDFDLISTRIYEETSESMMTTDRAQCSDVKCTQSVTDVDYEKSTEIVEV